MSTDILPRRNLGLSENWGRSLEGRVAGVTRALGIEIQALHGLGRYSASSAEEFSRNARKVEAALLALPRYFAVGATTATPNVTTSWSTIASVTIPVPEGKSRAEVLAVATSALPVPSSAAPTTRFVWPFSLGLVTSEYGPRDSGFHEGIDFAGGAASAGSPIPASGSGVVAAAVTGHPGWGNYVRLQHDVDGTAMSTLYAHMNAPPLVSTGQSVTQGQTLGYVGNTGNSFGAHLHFETWTGTSFGTHADPRGFIALFGGGTVVTPSSPARLRIRIGDATSIEFSGLLSTTTPVTLSYRPIFGRSFGTSGTSFTVALEAISGAAITGTAATLSVTGSFH